MDSNPALSDRLKADSTRLGNLFRVHKGRIVIFTGAGVSTSAKIPDYRGTNGVYRSQVINSGEESRPILKHANVSRAEPDCFPRALTKQMTDSHSPTAPNNLTADIQKTTTIPKLRLPEATYACPTYTHMAIKELIKHGYVRHVVSQNVDGLHLRSGLPREQLSEFHGNLFIEQCVACNKTVFRAFDVAETTSRAHHLTGRICPFCSIKMPSEATRVEVALRTGNSINGTNSKSELVILRKQAAQRLATCFGFDTDDRSRTDGTVMEATQQPSRPPLLRDVIVHYFEKQPESGLKDIYRVESAVEAIHGQRLLRAMRNVDAQNARPGRTKAGKRRPRKPCWYKSSHLSWDKQWSARMRRAMEMVSRDCQTTPEMKNQKFVKLEDTKSPVPTIIDGMEDGASLIVVIGSSLAVLRHYTFLWPSGLGRVAWQSSTMKHSNENACSLSEPPTKQLKKEEPIITCDTISPLGKRCKLAIINIQPTCKDGIANLISRIPCDTLLKAVMEDELCVKVESYDTLKDDQILQWALPLRPDEEVTRTRLDIQATTI